MNVLFNDEKLTSLISNLYTLMGIQTNIYDADGKDMQLFGKHSDFCLMMNSSAEGHSRCVSCDAKAVKKCTETKKPYFYYCHAGLIEAVLPIFDNSEPIAFIAFGQLLKEPPTQERWEEVEAKLDWFTGDRDALKRAFFSLNQTSEEKIKSYADILQAMASYIQLEGMIKSAQLSDQQRLEAFIDQHFAEDISMKRLSQELGMGTTKLCALARKIDSEGSITKLVTLRRIEAAKHLMLKERLSISEIAERVGFNDYNYFTKVFRKYEGIPPTAYKKKMR